MLRLISLAILVFYVSFCAISCGPNMPKDNPKFRGAGQGTGTGTAPTDAPATPPSDAPAEPPADTPAPPPENPSTPIPPTPPGGDEDPTEG